MLPRLGGAMAAGRANVAPIAALEITHARHTCALVGTLHIITIPCITCPVSASIGAVGGAVTIT